MALCDIFLFSTWDLDPQAEFPHEFGAWADGDPVSYYRKTGDLSREKYDGVEQTRTVTSEGLQSPVHGLLNVQPPKYPPHQLIGYRCDHSIIAAVENHAQIIVYSINTVDPDDYDSLPAAMKDMRPDDPIGETLWGKLLTGLVNVTANNIGQDEADQLEVALTNWRSANPEGTARDFALALRRSTS